MCCLVATLAVTRIHDSPALAVFRPPTSPLPPLPTSPTRLRKTFDHASGPSAAFLIASKDLFVARAAQRDWPDVHRCTTSSSWRRPRSGMVTRRAANSIWFKAASMS